MKQTKKNCLEARRSRVVGGRQDDFVFRSANAPSSLALAYLASTYSWYGSKKRGSTSRTHWALWGKTWATDPDDLLYDSTRAPARPLYEVLVGLRRRDLGGTCGGTCVGTKLFFSPLVIMGRRRTWGVDRGEAT